MSVSSGYHYNALAQDSSDGDGGSVIPKVVDISEHPWWLDWPGHWGGSDASPQGPSHQDDKFDDPAAWASDIDGCTEDQVQTPRAFVPGGRVRHPAPALPRVTVKRRGQRAAIRYRFPNRGRLHSPARPWQLLTSVDAAGHRYPPLTARRRVRSRVGHFTQSLGAGHGPYRLLVAVRGKNGDRSRVVALQFR